MSDMELNKIESKEIWVDLYEAAELTGYSIVGLRGVIQRMKQLAEEEREIKVRKRTGRWELWLPDILIYVDRPNRGPNRRGKQSSA